MEVVFILLLAAALFVVAYVVSWGGRRPWRASDWMVVGWGASYPLVQFGCVLLASVVPQVYLPHADAVLMTLIFAGPGLISAVILGFATGRRGMAVLVVVGTGISGAVVWVAGDLGELVAPIPW